MPLLAIRKKAAWLVVFLLLVAAGEVSLSIFRGQQESTAWKGITAVLRNEINSSNSYEIARSLSDLEKVNWIKCVVLTESTSGQRIFYDTTTQSYCGYPVSHVHGNLQAINGSKWLLSFVIPMDTWFLLFRLLLPACILALMYGAFRYLENLRLARESEQMRAQVEKALVLDVTKQSSHDLASPLGLLRIIAKQQQIPEVIREIMERVAERMDSVFKDLKAVNQVDRVPEQRKLSLEKFDIDKLLKASVAAKQREFNLSNSSIKIDLKGCDVFAQSGTLSRIISNVLNNSIEAKADVDRLEISITSRVVRDRVVIIFKDNGCGIPPEILKKLGAKGFSYGKSEKTNSGIGLYGAIESLKDFGGNLSIESSMGTGTLVRIELRAAG